MGDVPVRGLDLLELFPPFHQAAIRADSRPSQAWKRRRDSLGARPQAIAKRRSARFVGTPDCVEVQAFQFRHRLLGFRKGSGRLAQQSRVFRGIRIVGV